MVAVHRAASLQTYVAGDITEDDIDLNNGRDKARFIEAEMKEGSMKSWVAAAKDRIVGVCCTQKG